MVTSRVESSDRGSARGRRASREGFTLIEALAAFAIVAVLSLVLQRGLVQARQGLAIVEARSAAERVARSLLAEPVRLADVLEGGRRGVLDGHRFEIRLSPLDLPLPEAEPVAQTACPAGATCDPGRTGGPPGEERRWQLLRQDIVVAPARGAPLAIETIRLGPVPSDR